MAKIHPLAIVDSKAQLGSDVEVGPYCTVGPDVKIGAGTKLVSHVVIEGNTTIGINNVIHPFAVLGGTPQDLKYKGEKTELIIGDGNTIRESATLNLGTVQGGGKTLVGSNNLIMAYVHLGHDVILGSHCVLANYAGLAGHAIVEDHAVVGGLTGIVQFCRVGTHAYIGGASVIERDVPPFSIVVGARPCELKGANLVGLRRKGFKNESISAVNEAIKLWRQTELQKEDCLQKIESEYGSVDLVQSFLGFIRKSENGCIR